MGGEQIDYSLSDAPLDEIWEEIKRRHPKGAVLFVVQEPKVRGGDDGHQGYWTGGFVTAMGLTEYARMRLARNAYDSNPPEEDA